MGSRANENVEVDEVGVYGNDDVVDWVSTENSPSRTDCLRA